MSDEINKSVPSGGKVSETRKYCECVVNHRQRISGNTVICENCGFPIFVPSGGEQCPTCESGERTKPRWFITPEGHFCPDAWHDHPTPAAQPDMRQEWLAKSDPVSAEATKPQLSGVLCAKWKVLDDGCVARCDQPHSHSGKHLDSVIAIGWAESVEQAREYATRKDGEGFSIPNKTPYLLKCCDCGLEHMIAITAPKLRKGTPIGFAAKRLEAKSPAEEGGVEGIIRGLVDFAEGRVKPFKQIEAELEEVAAPVPQTVNYLQQLPGGMCFAHGRYEGMQCPKWPDCARVATEHHIALQSGHHDSVDCGFCIRMNNAKPEPVLAPSQVKLERILDAIGESIMDASDEEILSEMTPEDHAACERLREKLLKTAREWKPLECAGIAHLSKYPCPACGKSAAPSQVKAPGKCPFCDGSGSESCGCESQVKAEGAREQALNWLWDEVGASSFPPPKKEEFGAYTANWNAYATAELLVKFTAEKQAEISRLNDKIVALTLEVARLTVKPIVEKERECER